MIRLIKRYGGGSRKLYDTEESRYVSLDEISSWIRDGQELRVVDSSTGDDVTAQTLAQIIEHYPNQAAADVARNRMDLLKLELKAKTLTRSVKLGDYEQNIGLKQAFRGKT